MVRRILAVCLWILLGWVLSSAGSTPSNQYEEPEAKVVGEGNLSGWVITYEGEAICWNLYAHTGSKQIECE